MTDLGLIIRLIKQKNPPIAHAVGGYFVSIKEECNR